MTAHVVHRVEVAVAGKGGDPLAPESLEFAMGWLERGLDQLTEAARRQGREIQRQAMGPTVAAPRVSAAEGPKEAEAPSFAAPKAGASTAATTKGAAAKGSAAKGAATPKESEAAPPATPAAGPDDRPAAATPLLDQVGRDLTALARKGELAPVIGRSDEIGWLTEVLVRTTKRNPMLLGPAGAGKTSIVEGLAQRIAAGNVPEPLIGTRIVEVPLASLVAGTSYRGQLEERLQQLVREASTPGIVLFFDEAHLLAGAGRSEGGMGADQVLKPALARGDVAVIGATTPDEYRDTVEKDDALARRFTTIAIAELTKAQTKPIVQSVRDTLARRRGVDVSDDALDVLLDFAERRIANRRFPDKAIDLLEEAVAQAIVAGHTEVERNEALAATSMWEQRASSTPTLDRYGRDIVALARKGTLAPIVGRDAEIDAVAEILLRRTKRNPLLLGPAGSGKTAIVEGFAERIAAGRVPEPLKEIRLFDVPLTALAGAIEREPDRLRDLLAEARHPSVIVFFDEIHVLASPGARPLAESLKPALSRGDIACIGATTGEEYQAYIEPDAALARRFSPVSVQPMDDAGVADVLLAVRDSLAKLRGIRVTDDALTELRELAATFIPNRSFPDKGVDLVEQAVAFALVRGATDVDVPLAREAAAAYLGFPLDPGPAIATLRAAVVSRALLDESSLAALERRLAVSLRGLDAASERPDAAILLAGRATATADRLSATIAETLFGRSTARIVIDLSAMSDDSSVSTLLGSAPGLVGSERPLPLHELRRAPRQVVLFRGVDRCAEDVRNVIAAALRAGHFTDAMGRVIPLASAVVVLTATGLDEVLGTLPAPLPGEQARGVLAAALGADLVASCDVVVVSAPDTGGATDRAAWAKSELLEPLARRFARVGLSVTFDASFVEWLLDRLAEQPAGADAFLDATVTPALVGSVPAGSKGVYVARVVDGAPALEPVSPAT